MQECQDSTQDYNSFYDENKERFKERAYESMLYLLKRAILFVSFGPGVLGCLWMIGRLLRR